MGNLAEHQMLGNSVVLKGLAEKDAEPLKQENGLDLRFGDILGLAGDFFGAKSSGMIAAGDTEADREARFLSAYGCLAEDAECVPLVKELLKDADREREAVLNGMAEGKKAIEVYDAGITSDRHFELDSWWYYREWQIKSYASLAAVNIDHFGESAVESYSVGHRLAMRAMQEAFAKKEDQEVFRALLTRAYSLEAFASHYLTDLFAAGHIRTPRKELMDSSFSSTSAGICAWYQHREDGNLGLLVTNKRGDNWKTYGDGHWFGTHSDDVISAKKMIVGTLQAACDSLFAVATGGAVPTPPVALEYTPTLRPEGNHSPLFRIKSGTENDAIPGVERRKDVADPSSTEYTSDWNTVGTWALLKVHNVGAL